MNPHFDVLKIRKNLGLAEWKVPYEFIEHQWVFDSRLEKHYRIIVSCAPYQAIGDGEVDWYHASISHEDSIPEYDELVMMHRAVFNDGWAYQIFSPQARHINMHKNALHLWGRADGEMIHPDFQAQVGINLV